MDLFPSFVYRGLDVKQQILDLDYLFMTLV